MVAERLRHERGAAWPIDHWLVLASQLPKFAVAAAAAVFLAVEASNLAIIGEVNTERNRIVVGAFTSGAVLVAWSPVTVGAVLYVRRGRARPWLMWGPVPVVATATFLLITVVPLVVLGVWALAAPAVVAGSRYGRQESAIPPLPETG